ncbi:hypothetical protein Bhyg_07987 [Pseudolycoriella hygida]|uniref:Uncharacterized protein n=1 Tax=Pseudolycoriella hygida TaxID=35572 RepID=A0A9Q0N4N5_9DIPT|nr:hypothetical protein Bhyg_07987 [Pseudolycoriella hygida]
MDKTDAHSSWTGLWFPENPDQISKDQTVVDDETLQMAESRSNEDWKGLWFPGPPGQSIPTTFGNVNDSQLPAMGISELNCDDGRTNLALDYDPRNISHHSRHLCTDEKRLFAPSYDTKPKLLDYTIPPEYTALHKCMNEEIEYNDVIPTFGSHRKLWPVYGEYVYVPPQRWIHSLEHGAIVLLYHPCVNLNQLDIVRSLIKKCLYRHVITAYDLLDPERPFALVSFVYMGYKVPRESLATDNIIKL